MRLNIPTLLTLFRLILIPFLVIFFYIPFKYSGLICAVIFAVASITDFLDGYLSRKLHQTTSFGAFLDPVSDKVLVAVSLILIEQQFPHLLVVIPVILIISREIIVSALREWMASMGKRSVVAVAMIGKIKTATQMISIIILLANVNKCVNIIGMLALIVAAVLTVWSMLLYLNSAKLSFSQK